MTVAQSSHDVQRGITAFSEHSDPTASSPDSSTYDALREFQPGAFAVNTAVRWGSPVTPRVQVAGARAMPLQSVIDRINHLLSLRPNWDSYDASPPSLTAAIAGVQWFLNVYEPELPIPSIVPGHDGSIQFEWHVGGIHLEVLFLPTGRTLLAFEDLVTGEEQPDFKVMQSDLAITLIRRIIDRHEH